MQCFYHNSKKVKKLLLLLVLNNFGLMQARLVFIQDGSEDFFKDSSGKVVYTTLKTFKHS